MGVLECQAADTILGKNAKLMQHMSAGTKLEFPTFPEFGTWGLGRRCSMSGFRSWQVGSLKKRWYSAPYAIVSMTAPTNPTEVIVC
jgi:hypothetical protein